MSRAAAIGDERRLAGFALAGATVVHAATRAEVESAWSALPDDIVLVVLTSDAFEVVEPRLAERSGLVWAVMPA